MPCVLSWDWLMLDGQKTLHRVSLAILKLAEETLLMYDFEGIVYYLKNLPDEGHTAARHADGHGADFYSD